jgi:hypothetical protein
VGQFAAGAADLLPQTAGADLHECFFADSQCRIAVEDHQFGGCFSFRPQRTGTKLSTHAWGIALDLNPESNAQGTAGNMDARVVAIFKQAGFTWGGDWHGRVRDPIRHFQFCTGY